MIGSQDLLLVLGFGLFFFGAKKLPELSRSLGQAVSEFRKGLTTPEEPPGEAPAPADPAAPRETPAPADPAAPRETPAPTDPPAPR